MVKGSKTVTPKLRFPEFRNAPGWETAPLEKIAERVSTKNTDGAVTRVLTNSAEYGVLNQRDYFDRDIASAGKVDGYYIVDTGDYVYNPRTSAIAPVGPISRNNVGKGVMSPLYTVFRFAAEKTDFYERFFKSTGWHSYVRNAASTGARHDRMSITTGAFMQMPVPTPNEAEQQKIASCLTSLQELIAAQGRKVEALTTYKHGLMSQLFPGECETTPNLRFPEFRDTPDWEPTTLGALVDFQSGSTPSKINPAFWNGSTPWVSAKDMKRLFLDDSEDHISAAAVDDGAKVAPAGTVLMLTRGMTLLKDVPICVLRREMSFNQDVKGLRPKGKTDGLFVALLLIANKRRLLKMVDIAGHGTGKLNTDELKALELAAPKAAEQQRIAGFLSSLDFQIETEVHKLAVLSVHNARRNS
jgi:type I restriction enzyme S subunit